MKKTVAIILSLILVWSLAGCGPNSGDSQASDDNGGKTELIIFAASSMTESLEEVGELYKETNPDISLIFNFDSSGTLKTQIEEGAVCDIFISAAQKQMDDLDSLITAESDIDDGLNLLLPDTRTDILENKVVLSVPEDNPGNIASFDDLAEGLRSGTIVLAMGNEDVPVGQYTKKILDFYGLNENDLVKSGLITYCSNVKEVTTQVSEGSVDAGIIYATDAFSAGLEPIDTADEKMCGKVVYPAAVLSLSTHPEAATDFLNFLKSGEASEVFKKVGFSPLF